MGSSRTRSADVRLLTATNSDLALEVAEGRFRRDLYFRVRTVEIQLPPLRDRREDLLPLAERFRAAHGKRYRKEIAGFDAAAVRAIERHSWPGNVRELDHAVERAVLLARGARISALDLGLEGTPASRGLEEMTLEEVEEHLIKKARRYGGNVSQAASALACRAAPLPAAGEHDRRRSPRGRRPARTVARSGPAYTAARQRGRSRTGVKELSPQELRELAAELWQSSALDEPASIPDWHWPLVSEALAEHERDPDGALPGEDLLAWLRRPRA